MKDNPKVLTQIKLANLFQIREKNVISIILEKIFWEFIFPKQRLTGTHKVRNVKTGDQKKKSPKYDKDYISIMILIAINLLQNSLEIFIKD